MVRNSIKYFIYLDWTPIGFQLRWSMPNLRKSLKEENEKEKKEKREKKRS